MKLNVAVVGATGLVGETMMRILEQVDFPINHFYPVASKRSKGKALQFQNKIFRVESLDDFDFSKVDIALFSAGGSISKEYAPIAAKHCLVIDNTSTFRLDPDIPLVIPEVNPEDIQYWNKRNIIANPNCSTIQMLVALNPIHQVAKIKRINVATYQAVSGAGKKAVEELKTQMASGGDFQPNIFPIPIAYNAIPHIDTFQDNGYTREEMKMVWETQKILHDEHIKVNPTCVRIPVETGHSEAVHIETEHKLSASEVRDLLSNAPGVVVIDQPQDKGYPSPLIDAAHKDEVFVGRIREDISYPTGLNLWIVSDNIRKGAALNSIQIAQLWADKYK